MVSQTAATTSAFAAHDGYHVDVARDFIGVGAGSILSGLFGSFAVNASPARTAAVASTGGRTQAAGLGAAVVMVALIPAAGLLTDVPLATLAAVLIFVATRIFHGRDLLHILRFDIWEFVLALVTLVVVAVVGVEQGIAVAVGLAILDRTRRSARPKTFVLGPHPGHDQLGGVASPQRRRRRSRGASSSSSVPPSTSPMPVTSASNVHAALAAASPPPHLLVLDAVAMGDIDYTGTRALAADARRTRPRPMSPWPWPGPWPRRPENLARSGLLDRIGRDHLFPSVDEAVVALGQQATHRTGASRIPRT